MNKRKILKINYFKWIFILNIAKFTAVLMIFLINIILYKNNISKICICTIGKLENNYIVEFIDYYRKYKVDKIFLYDNNELNGENFIIPSKYIRRKYVEIINWRGQKTQQLKFFKDCYETNYKKYDWLIFYDIDEYLNLTNYSNIHHYLSEQKFKQCQLVYINWRLHTDNNKMFYENRNLFERFPNYYNRNDYSIGKSIIKGNIENISFDSPHYIDKKLNSCKDFNFIEHYEFKSTEEYISKINLKGDVRFENNMDFKYKRIMRYFRFNQITLDKINYIANKTGFNPKYLFLQLKKYKIKYI